MTPAPEPPRAQPAARPPPGRRASYAAFVPLTTRWMDNDVFGHVNNVVYYSLFDTAVCHLLVTAGLLRAHGDAPLLMVVAESGCRYHTEVAFPDRLTAGVRVGRLGSSSVRWEIGIFREPQDTASAEGFMVHVCVAAADRRPVPLPAAWREVLQLHEVAPRPTAAPA